MLVVQKSSVSPEELDRILSDARAADGRATDFLVHPVRSQRRRCFSVRVVRLAEAVPSVCLSGFLSEPLLAL